MTRFLLQGSMLRYILFVAVCVLACAFLCVPPVLAQHGGGGGHGGGFGGGGHMGGMGGGAHMGGARLSGGAHMGGPPALAPRPSHAPMIRPRGSFGPPPVGAGVRAPRFHQHPSHVVHNHRVFFGQRFHRFRHGFYPYWWPYWCPYNWGWGSNCNGWPSYGYGYGYDWGFDPTYYAPDPQSVAPSYARPAYRNGRTQRDLVELYLKDGTVLDVTDYWLEDGKVHFRTREGSVEQVLSVDQLDLQTTVDVNTRRGLQFVLRNEPDE